MASIQLKWREPLFGKPIEGYIVTYRVKGSSDPYTEIYVTSGVEYVIDDTSSNISYEGYVKSNNGGGNISDGVYWVHNCDSTVDCLEEGDVEFVEITVPISLIQPTSTPNPTFTPTVTPTPENITPTPTPTDPCMDTQATFTVGCWNENLEGPQGVFVVCPSGYDFYYFYRNGNLVKTNQTGLYTYDIENGVGDEFYVALGADDCTTQTFTIDENNIKYQPYFTVKNNTQLENQCATGDWTFTIENLEYGTDINWLIVNNKGTIESGQSTTEVNVRPTYDTNNETFNLRLNVVVSNIYGCSRTYEVINFNGITLCPTPTPTITITPTLTPTITITPTFEETPTPTPESSNETPTPSPDGDGVDGSGETPTPTPTITTTPSPLDPCDVVVIGIYPTPTPTLTPTYTITPTLTVTPTYTPTLTPTVTLTQTITPTITPTLTQTVTPTYTITPTITPTLTQTITPTLTITPTITPTLTLTITPTVTPTITPTTTPTVTPTTTVTPTLTQTVTPTITPTLTVTPTVEDPSITPTITITPTVTPTITIGLAEVLPTPTPTIESTPFPTPDYGPTPTPTPTITDDTLSSALSTPTPTIESTPFPTLFPTPTPAVTSVSFACRLDVVGSVEEDPTLCQLNVVASYIQPTPTPTIDLANCILELTASSEELDCSLTINSSYEALPVTYNFNVINNGTSNWEIENEGFDPELVVKVGDTLNFTNYSSSVHPFYIKTAQTTGTTNLVSGVSGQGSHSGGTTSWTPLTTGTYYYQCSNHINMSGVITVTN